VAKDPAHRFTNTSDLVTALEGLPFHTEDQRSAKDILRRLARGYRVPIVQTGMLPPLPDALEASVAAARSAKRFRSRTLVMAGLGMVALVSGAWWGLEGTPIGTRPRPDSVFAVPKMDSARLSPSLKLPTAAAQRIPHLDAPAQAGPGRVRLRTEPPNAVIYIDDREVGIGTVFDLAVPAGARRLRIKSPGSATFDTTFHVTAGTTTRLGLIALRDLP